MGKYTLKSKIMSKLRSFAIVVCAAHWWLSANSPKFVIGQLVKHPLVKEDSVGKGNFRGIHL